jgi:hypothetical protein
MKNYAETFLSPRSLLCAGEDAKPIRYEESHVESPPLKPFAIAENTTLMSHLALIQTLLY